MGVNCKCIYGEVDLDERQQIITDFKSGELQVLLTNPHTLAESVSLHNICHDAIYFEYSYNLVHLLQSKDRIHRLGLSENQYTQYYYMQTYYSTDDGNWSMDRAVYDRLKEKEQIMLDAIDNNILEILPTSNDDLDIIFAKLK
jgi:DNA-directed RNA polymerase subunit F